MALLKDVMDRVFDEQGKASSPEHQSVLNAVLGMIAGGGLHGLLDAFRQKGYGQAVESWIGNGENKPVSVEQVQDSLGDQKVEEIAQKAGQPKEKTAGILAELLPHVVDKLTPEGKVPDASGLSGLLQRWMGGDKL